MRAPLSLLDPWILRAPFEGRSARRYATHERGAFGDLDERLIAAWAPELSTARTVLDVGAGTGTLARKLALAAPGARVIAVEPSATYTENAAAAVAPAELVRACAERLPLDSGAVDLAICLSSIRHVRDRHIALVELRRVVREGGAVYLVELDPRADSARVARHTAAMSSALSRATFRAWVLPFCPPPSHFADAARAAGFARVETRPDPLQPVEVLRLS